MARRGGDVLGCLCSTQPSLFSSLCNDNDRNNSHLFWGDLSTIDGCIETIGRLNGEEKTRLEKCAGSWDRWQKLFAYHPLSHHPCPFSKFLTNLIAESPKSATNCHPWIFLIFSLRSASSGFPRFRKIRKIESLHGNKLRNSCKRY